MPGPRLRTGPLLGLWVGSSDPYWGLNLRAATTNKKCLAALHCNVMFIKYSFGSVKCTGTSAAAAAALQTAKYNSVVIEIHRREFAYSA